MDFGALQPENNSGRMHTGPGCGLTRLPQRRGTALAAAETLALAAFGGAHPHEDVNPVPAWPLGPTPTAVHP